MPRWREITLPIPSVRQVDVPFALVEGSAAGVLIVTMDDEWLTDEQLAEIAARKRKVLATKRRKQKRVDLRAD